MGIWLFGPMPHVGTCVSLADHALVALRDPHQCDNDASQLDKGFQAHCYKYTVPQLHDDVVQLDMDDEYWTVNHEANIVQQYS
ncbi:MAG: hypothetical protein ACKPKO_10220, partial [Candidatus Fonsibacter sp.]